MTCKASWGGEDCYESTLLDKNRKRVPVAISITASRDDMGGIIGYTLIATDIAVATQVRFEPYGLPSIAQQDTGQESDLLTRVSHEMRTPLSAILGFAQLMDSDSPSPTLLQKRRIDRIIEAGWYLEKLINMTHDLALIESGTLPLSLEAVPLADLMRDCQAKIESQAQIRGVRVTFPGFDAPCSVAADRTRLRDVLDHLLYAAIENSDVDAMVVVNCESSKDLIRVRIDHCSDGMSADRVGRPILPHEGQQHRAIADGRGLGLLLAKRLVEMMGGVISADRGDDPRQLFAFDLKRALVPLAVGRAAPTSVGAETQVPNGRGSQNRAHSAASYPATLMK
jgi:signal transduction histidine kinase